MIRLVGTVSREYPTMMLNQDNPSFATKCWRALVAPPACTLALSCGSIILTTFTLTNFILKFITVFFCHYLNLSYSFLLYNLFQWRIYFICWLRLLSSQKVSGVWSVATSLGSLVCHSPELLEMSMPFRRKDWAHLFVCFIYSWTELPFSDPGLPLSFVGHLGLSSSSYLRFLIISWI